MGSFFRSRQFLLVGLIALNSIDIGFYLDRHGWKWFDSDESIMWLAATDASEGRLYTPAFYGQSYNTHFESYCAVPLILLGVPVYKAVKTVSVALAYLPFLLFGLNSYRQGNFQFLWWLGWPLLLPMEWQLITCASRGFIPGIALATLGCWILFLLQTNATRMFIGASIAFLGFVVNPNAAAVLLPMGLFWLIERKEQLKRMLIPGIFSIVPALSLWLFNQYFHKNHPMYNLHQLWDLNWSMENWKHSFTQINWYFNGFFPFQFQLGIWWLFLCTIVLLVSFRYRRTIFWSSFSFVVFFALILGTTKLTDGEASVFFPASRFFIGIGVLMPFWLSRLTKNQKWVAKVLPTIIFLSCIINWTTYHKRHRANKRAISGQVALMQISILEEMTNELKQYVTTNNIELVVFHSKAVAFNYGSVALNPSINTVHPAYDRRWWQFEKEMFKMRDVSKVVFIDWGDEIPNKLEQAVKVPDFVFPAYRLPSDTASLLQLYHNASLTLRPHGTEQD